MNDVRAGFEFILSNALISLTGKLRPRAAANLPKLPGLEPIIPLYLCCWLPDLLVD